MYDVIPENFDRVKQLYDVDMGSNGRIHDLVYPHVFGRKEYIGQFSDNSAGDLLAMGEKMAEMASLATAPGHCDVLDVGCGRGRVAAFLSDRLKWRVTGIDVSGVPIDDARRKYGQRTSLRFIHADVYQHHFRTPFDGAYGTGSFCHFEAGSLFRRL